MLAGNYDVSHDAGPLCQLGMPRQTHGCGNNVEDIMNRPSWAPPEIDVTRPSAARVYDYYLGGSHNFEVDRRMAEEAMRLWPELPQIMQANRAFLGRAVRFLANEGITQFIDIGSGIPTADHVHEVAQQANPDSRVVYVDRDPVAVAHSRAILANDTHTTVVHADLRQTERIVEDADVRSAIDFSRPVALLMVAVLHFVPDEDDPATAVQRLCDPLPEGSYLVISHASADNQPDRAATHQQLYQRTPTPMTMRTDAQVASFFAGFELVPPGLVSMPLWRPNPAETVDSGADQMAGYAGVGRKG